MLLAVPHCYSLDTTTTITTVTMYRVCLGSNVGDSWWFAVIRDSRPATKQQVSTLKSWLEASIRIVRTTS